MNVEAHAGVIEVRVGPSFRRLDAMRIDEVLTALGSFSRLNIDFALVHDCDDAALVLLATLLRRLSGQVELSGLTHHQWRLLTYAGLFPDRSRPQAAAGA